MTARLVGTKTAWQLGEGSTRYEPLAVVAVADGRVVGAISVRPIDLNPELMVRNDHNYDPSTLPWWKIHILVVDDHYQSRGIAHALLRHVVDGTPREVIGLYGNVVESNSHAITWYRRQGFYIAPRMAIRPHGGSARVGAMLLPVRGEIYFRGYKENVAAHLAQRGHPRSELRTAEQEFEADVRQLGTPDRSDLGYRLYANKVAAEDTTSACMHAAMGPRTLVVVGWDPEHRHVCVACTPERIQAVQAHDASSRCDGCGRTDPDVRVSWAALKDELLIVHCGLCPSCRAGVPASTQVDRASAKP